MSNKVYAIPMQIIDDKEALALDNLTKAYEKMIAPNAVNKAINKAGEKVPEPVKKALAEIKDTVSANELFIKSLEVLGHSFQTLEQFAAKVTLSEEEVIKQINAEISSNPISKLDEICLVRSYELSKIVNKYKMVDIIAAATEGAATGAPGFAGIPFNLVLSTFLFYRAVQSVALFYGYDIKNDPAELQIASEVFIYATNPKSSSSNELSSVIAKIMLLSTATSLKQTVKKGWTAMAEKGGIYLLAAQMRALANNAAKSALEKAGKKGLEKTIFSEVLEQIGKKLTQKSISTAVPYIGAVIGAAIDTSQMINILKFADIFYCKRFILEKEMRINMLSNSVPVDLDVDNFVEVVVVDD